MIFLPADNDLALPVFHVYWKRCVMRLIKPETSLIRPTKQILIVLLAITETNTFCLNVYFFHDLKMYLQQPITNEEITQQYIETPIWIYF